MTENEVQLPKSNSPTPVQHFYKNSKIFITGGTGFLGRILIEKLLRSCPDLTKIYLLIRQKKGKHMETRLNELFKDDIFNKLREEQPDFTDKVVAVAGDIGELRLGLSEDDRQMIIQDITLVFHVAATVRFDEKIKAATFINIRGTREVLALCKEIKNLHFVTHVSTAYSHCLLRTIEEKFYPAPYDPHQMITLAECISDKVLDEITDKLTGDYPNTYAFTKGISEDLIRECGSDLPIAVFRPAIIVSTYQEPIPGWINNFYGPQGVSTAAMLGLLRSLHCDENVNSNIVPVDMCANSMVAIPWECRDKYDAVIAHNKKPDVAKDEYEVPIYHYESNTDNPLDWKKFRYLTHFHGQNYLSAKMIGVYFFHLRANLLSHNIAIFFLHLLPAFLTDTALTCIGKKPMLTKAYEKVHKFSEVISYFTTKEWDFKSKNIQKLCANMNAEDNKIFFCDMKELNWDKFFKTYLKGCRTYLLKDPIETVDAATKRYKNKVVPLTYMVVSVFCILMLTLVWYTMKFVLTPFL